MGGNHGVRGERHGYCLVVRILVAISFVAPYVFGESGLYIGQKICSVSCSMGLLIRMAIIDGRCLFQETIGAAIKVQDLSSYS